MWAAFKQCASSEVNCFNPDGCTWEDLRAMGAARAVACAAVAGIARDSARFSVGVLTLKADLAHNIYIYALFVIFPPPHNVEGLLFSWP